MRQIIHYDYKTFTFFLVIFSFLFSESSFLRTFTPGMLTFVEFPNAVTF